MNQRQERGLAIAETAIVKTPVGWKVPSASGVGTYVVNVDGDKPFCTCPDFEARNEPCKHIYAVEFTVKREEKPDGTTVVTKTMRVTYAQNWHTYNEAQTHEADHSCGCSVSCATPFRNPRRRWDARACFSPM